MRRGLIWSLGATVVLAGVSLWLESKPAKVVAALVRPRGGEASAPLVIASTSAHGPLPATLDLIQVEPARRDIFVPVEPPAPKAPPAPLPPPPPPPASPPAPTAPPLTLRYLGMMVTPTGERLVMLARGDSSVTIQAGTRLDEGYVVESIDTGAVHLVYPPLGTAVDIPIPPTAPQSR